MSALKEVPAGEFKQKCLALMTEVALLGVELVITKHGTPICKITPIPKDKENPRFGWLKGTVKIHGDLTLPLGVEWQANT